MHIITLLRPENATLVAELCNRGHWLYMERSAAVMFRRMLNKPIQPIDWPDTRMPLPELFGYGEMYAGVIDALDGLTTFRNEDADQTGVQPDALITWTDAPGPYRTAALWARARGVPSFEVTHGALNTYRQGHFECDSYVDTILAPGQEEVDFRRFYGNKTPIIVTGKPSFDWIASIDRAPLRQAIRERFNLPDRRPLVLYGMTWRHAFSTWERDRDIGVAEVLSAHMTLQPICAPFLVIKPHPSAAARSDVRKLHESIQRDGIVEYAVADADVRTLLPAADLVVSHKSSLLVEAVLMGIPCVGFDFRERNDFAFYAGRGIEWVSDRKQLTAAIARCLLDRSTKDRLGTERAAARHYFNGPDDGRATERAADTIEQVCAERRAA